MSSSRNSISSKNSEQKSISGGMFSDDFSLGDTIASLRLGSSAEEVCEELTQSYTLAVNKKKGIGKKAESKAKLTPLMEIARKNDAAIFQGFLAFIKQKKLQPQDLEINALDDNGRTALMHLTNHAKVTKDVLQFLKQLGPECKIVDRDGKTAAAYAIAHGDTSTFALVYSTRATTKETTAWISTAGDWAALQQCSADKAEDMCQAMVERLRLPVHPDPDKCLEMIKSTILYTIEHNPELACKYIRIVRRHLQENITACNPYNQWLQTLFTAVRCVDNQYQVAKTILNGIDPKYISYIACDPKKTDWLATQAFLHRDKQTLEKLALLKKDILSHLRNDLATIVKFCEHDEFESNPARSNAIFSHVPMKAILREIPEQKSPPVEDFVKFVTLYDKSENFSDNFNDLKLYIAYAIETLYEQDSSLATLPALQAVREKFSAAITVKPLPGAWEYSQAIPANVDLAQAAWSGDVKKVAELIRTHREQQSLKSIINQEHVHPKTTEKLSPLCAAIKSLHLHGAIVVDLLLEQPELQLEKEDTNKNTALIVAIEVGSDAIASALLTAKKADGKISDKELQAAIMVAARRGKTDILTLLVASANPKALELVILELMSGPWGDAEMAVSIHAILLETYLVALNKDPKDTTKFIYQAVCKGDTTEAPDALLALYITRVNNMLRPGKINIAERFISDLIKVFANYSAVKPRRYDICKILLSQTPITFQVPTTLFNALQVTALMKDDLDMLFILYLRAKNKENLRNVFTHSESSVKLLQSYEHRNIERKRQELPHFPFPTVIRVTISAATRESPKHLLALIEAIYLLLRFMDNATFNLLAKTSDTIKGVIAQLKATTAEDQLHIESLKFYALRHKNMFAQFPLPQRMVDEAGKLVSSIDKAVASRKQVKDTYRYSLEKNLQQLKEYLEYLDTLLATTIPLADIESYLPQQQLLQEILTEARNAAFSNTALPAIATSIEATAAKIATAVTTRKAETEQKQLSESKDDATAQPSAMPAPLQSNATAATPTLDVCQDLGNDLRMIEEKSLDHSIWVDTTASTKSKGTVYDDALVAAAWAGDVGAVEGLIVVYASQLKGILNKEHVHPQTEEKLSPLFAAIKSHHVDAPLVVEHLLKQKEIQLDKKDAEGKTALVVAIELGLEKIANALLTTKMQRKQITTKERDAAIIAAAQKGMVTIVYSLTEKTRGIPEISERVMLMAMATDTAAAIAIQQRLLSIWQETNNANDISKFAITHIMSAYKAERPLPWIESYINCVYRILWIASGLFSTPHTTFIHTLIEEISQAYIYANRYEILKLLLSHSAPGCKLDDAIVDYLKNQAIMTMDISMIFELLIQKTSAQQELLALFIKQPEQAILLFQCRTLEFSKTAFHEFFDFSFDTVITAAAKKSPQCLLQLIVAIAAYAPRMPAPQKTSDLTKQIISQLKDTSGPDQDYINQLRLHASTKGNIFHKNTSLTRRLEKMQAELLQLVRNRERMRVAYENIIATTLSTHTKQLTTLVAILKTSVDIEKIGKIFAEYRPLLAKLCEDATHMSTTNPELTEAVTRIQALATTITNAILERKLTIAINQPQAVEEKSMDASSTSFIARVMTIPLEISASNQPDEISTESKESTTTVLPERDIDREYEDIFREDNSDGYVIS